MVVNGFSLLLIYGTNMKLTQVWKHSPDWVFLQFLILEMFLVWVISGYPGN